MGNAPRSRPAGHAVQQDQQKISDGYLFTCWSIHRESGGNDHDLRLWYGSMDAALIALTDRGVDFTFLGEPFRSRQEIPNADIVDINFRQVEIIDADVEALLPLTNLEGISFWKSGISDHAIALIAPLPRLTRLNLCGTQVTDASVPTLVGMALNYIDVADTRLTAHGVEMLRAGLPHAEILS